MTYRSVHRSFDGKSVKVFVEVCKKHRNIPTLYEMVLDYLGHPVYDINRSIHDAALVGHT